MNRLDELQEKLRRETAMLEVSPQVESALLREFTRTRGKRFRLPAAVLAAVAVLLLALWPKPKPAVTPPPRVIAETRPTPVLKAAAQPPKPKLKPKLKPRLRRPDPEPEFIRIPYSEPLGPHERAEIVRVELPVSALGAAGIRVATADTSARAQAELVVGEDGLARAVRLISILNNQ